VDGAGEIYGVAGLSSPQTEHVGNKSHKNLTIENFTPLSREKYGLNFII
jgi:hypothetical protein